jgi:hypothetical protein
MIDADTITFRTAVLIYVPNAVTDETSMRTNAVKKKPTDLVYDFAYNDGSNTWNHCGGPFSSIVFSSGSLK